MQSQMHTNKAILGLDILFYPSEQPCLESVAAHQGTMSDFANLSH